MFKDVLCPDIVAYSYLYLSILVQARRPDSYDGKSD